VDVGIDHPGHQHPSIGGDDDGSFRCLDRFLSALGDLVSDHQEVHAVKQALTFSIENPDILEQDRGFPGTILLLPDRSAQWEGDAGDQQAQRQRFHG
jgi:hypothetical protein